VVDTTEGLNFPIVGVLIVLLMHLY